MAVKRRLFYFLTALSLMFALATAVFWIRGYNKMDVFDLTWSRWEVEMLVPTDGMSFYIENLDLDSEHSGSSHEPLHANYYAEDYVPLSFRTDPAQYAVASHYHPWFNGVGKYWGDRGKFTPFYMCRIDGHPNFGWGVVIPTRYLMCFWMALPIAWILRAIRRRFQTPPGFCQRCNYDLRATPDRCPECGTVPAARPRGEWLVREFE